MTIVRRDGRVPVLYLAPWVDYGGSDKGTIDWLRWLDRDRFATFLATTQPSDNRLLEQALPYVEELWPLPEFLAGPHEPALIFDLIHTRGIQVLHIMNSRLGYELLPDLAALPRPPAVVVQLHVEEPDRSGYVRYVTTRYGNLVDAFSVSSRHLAEAVEGYEVPAGKIHVIPTGVDAQAEFNPDRVKRAVPVEEGDFNVLVPGRLTEQKDPLLMVDVIRRVAPELERLRVHVLGDGPLEAEVRAAVASAGLEERFRFHPPTRELAPWYAASDLMLMTSVFEGVPYVIYEAMAMEVPIVAPALPGNVELMADTAGILVTPRDDANRYAEALMSLARDRQRSEALARGGRERVLDAFGVQAMGHLHSRLYETLLASTRSPHGPPPDGTGPVVADAPRSPTSAGAEDDRGGQPSRATPAPRPPRPLRFTDRPAYAEPLVSVVMPCFNHGRFLREGVPAILDQDYPDLELIIVDDGSTDADTLVALDELSELERVRVIHQPVNSGPSVARNRAIAEARGRYILPVDADNVLLAGAVRSLVAQLQHAGERTGYIYPNLQYFGTRDDYFEPPAHNLALLLDGNYCDTCSLIDRQVFDAGVGYCEDIKLGHEDWDFALTLAEHDVIGEPAHGPTLLYRKHGFTRSDAVEHAKESFRARMAGEHPRLYGDAESLGRFWRWRGPAAETKGREAPGLSCVVTSPIELDGEEGRRLLERLGAQSCRDLELILECAGAPAAGKRIRRIPPGLCTHPVARLQEGLAMARGSMLMIAGEVVVDLLGDPGLVEKLYRTFWASPELEAIAFADAGEHGRFPYRLLAEGETNGPAHALIWDRSIAEALPPWLQTDGTPFAELLARVMSAHGVAIQWRHWPARAGGESANEATAASGRLTLPWDAAERDPHRRAERRMTASLRPAVPSLPAEAVPRWLGLPSWLPPESTLLVRHQNGSGEHAITIGREPPKGFALEYDIGAIRAFAPPGTVRLVEGEQAGDFRTVPRGAPRDPRDRVLGSLELAPLPLFEPVARAVLADGSVTLVAGERDPLRKQAVQLEHLGFIEAYPLNPPLPPDARHRAHGIVGLLRALDAPARRHRYSVGPQVPAGLVGELGALHLAPEPDSIAVYIEDGRLFTSAYEPSRTPHDWRQTLRWVAAPAGWRGFGHVRGRARSVARRARDAGLLAREPTPATAATASPAPVGFLYPQGGAGRLELLAATHPVSGDQLLTLHPLEAADMGYGEVVGLGFVLERAPVTGTLGLARVAVPWASHFGLAVRRG
jgi:glycosyltransferase involved in cell wall biosynthesis